MSFNEGDRVMVYDNRHNLSAQGEIVEVLGNNTYLVDVEDKGHTHVSGDVLSKLRDVATGQQQQNVGEAVSVDREPDDDNVSVATASSVDTELMADIPDDRGLGRIGRNVPGVGQAVGQAVGRRRQRRRRDVEMLESNQIIRQRLRPRP